MTNQLKEELINYKNFSLKLIKALNEENYDIMDKLLSERQECIDNLNAISHTKNEILAAFTEMELLQLEEQLNKLMNAKFHEAEDNIKKLAKSKNARKSYNNKFNVDSLYINKKI